MKPNRLEKSYLFAITDESGDTVKVGLEVGPTNDSNQMYISLHWNSNGILQTIARFQVVYF